RRADVGEDEVIVVPDGGRALGRNIRRPVGADRGEEAEALLLDDPLHVAGENPHRRSPSRALAQFYGFKRWSEMANPMRGKGNSSYLNLSSAGAGCRGLSPGVPVRRPEIVQTVSCHPDFFQK